MGSFPGQIPSQGPSVPLNHVHNSLQLSNNIGESSSSDKKLHQWSTNPVEEWAKEQVFLCSILCIVNLIYPHSGSRYDQNNINFDLTGLPVATCSWDGILHYLIYGQNYYWCSFIESRLKRLKRPWY